MTTAITPFIHKTVKCPACHHPYSQRYFRKNMFMPIGEEPDHHVTGYKWLNDRVTPVHPPHYFISFCPQCFYADTNEDFSDPWRTDFGPYVVKYFRRLTKAGDAAVETLGAHVNYEDIDFQSALMLHLIALYTQLLPPPDLQDGYKIARIFLRIAWLYRENPPGEPETQRPAPRPSPAAPPAEPAAAVSPARQLLAALDAFDERFSAFQQDAAAVYAAVDALIAEEAPEDAPPAGPMKMPRDRLEIGINNIAGTASQLRTLAKELAAWRPKPPEPAPPAADAPPTPRPKSPIEFRAWLDAIRKHWPMLPTGEETATRDAIKWFTRAIEKDSRLGSHEQYASIGTLITHLRLRLGEHEAALDMVNGMYQSAVETRMQCIEKQRESEELSPADRSRIDARLNRIVSGIEDLVDLREELITSLYERDKATILAILAETRGRPVKAREEALVAKGIRNEIITRLKRKGGPLAKTA